MVTREQGKLYLTLDKTDFQTKSVTRMTKEVIKYNRGINSTRRYQNYKNQISEL